VRVISTSRTGSQNPIEIPGTGTFALTHAQIGEAGFFVSRFFGVEPLPIFIPPIEIGSKHPQQMSEIGLTKCPLHVTLAFTENGINNVMISSTILLYLLESLVTHLGR
jgi:hypothetical protein